MNAANQLQKLKTGVMEHDQCAKAHEDSGSPVIENNNVCAGGEEGTIISHGVLTSTQNVYNFCFNRI